MNKTSALRSALLVDGIYAIIVGLALFFPSLAAGIFARPVKDAAVTSGWGTGIITIGLLAIAAASDVSKYGGLAWAFVVGLLLAAIDLIYFWVTGAYTARNVLAPIIINVVLVSCPKNNLTNQPSLA